MEKTEEEKPVEEGVEVKEVQMGNEGKDDFLTRGPTSS